MRYLSAIILFCALVTTGGLSHGHPTPAMEAARAVMQQLEAAYLDNDVDGAMALVASDATPSLVNTFLQGGFETSRINLRYATASQPEAGTIVVSPVLLEIDGGTFLGAAEVTLVFEGEHWKIRAMEDTRLPNRGIWLPELDQTRAISFRLTDAESGDPVHARVHIRDGSGDYWPARGHQRNIRTGWRADVGGDVRVEDKTWAYVEPEFVADLAEGEYTIEVQRGMEYLPTGVDFDVTAGDNTAVEVELTRLIDMNRLGWYSGDNHTHFLTDQTALLEAEGEDLNVVNVLATKWGELITDVTGFIGDDSPHSTSNRLIRVNEETRHRFLGHTILHPLKELVYPLTWGGPSEGVQNGYDWPPMAHQADKARAQGALVTWAHFPFPPGEVAVDVALGKVDTVDLFTWGDAFQDASGSIPGAVNLWYAMLNTGSRLTATAGTDKMLNTQVSGAVRMYAQLGRKRLNYDNWAAAIREGKTFATTGPMIFFTANGKPVGSDIRHRSGRAMKLEARVVSARPVRELQIVQGGVVIGEVKNPEGKQELTLEVEAFPQSSTWFAARAYNPELLPYQQWTLIQQNGVPLMAHTSPIYVNVDGTTRTSSPDAMLLVSYVDRAIEWAQNEARFKDESQREEMLALFREARKYYADQF